MKRINGRYLLLATLMLCMSSLAQVPGDAIWIDVRSPAEYAQGHLDRAQLIPYDGIEAGVSGLGLPKDAPIYLYCAVGARAEKARQSLQNIGYTNVTNVGGLEDALQLAREAQPGSP